MRSISLLLPLTIQTTVLYFISLAKSSRAATDNAPAGSTTMASSLYNFTIVEQTFPSDIRCRSSNTSLQIGNVMSPTLFTAAPSTNPSILSRVTGAPFFSASYIAGAPSGSRPIIFVFGDQVLKYEPTPALNPPPPTGTNK